MKLELKQNLPSEMFGRLFQLRDQIHLKHLKVTGQGSYSQHMALNDFYDELLDKIDDLIESYQGKYGLLNISIPQSKEEDPIENIGNICKLLESQKTFQDSWILNQIDEIITLGYKTLYKLKNLK